MKRALEGIRVLEVSGWVAGPFCGQLLAALGAEVIKVERPGTGEDSRMTAPFGGPEGINTDRRTPIDISTAYLRVNRGKKGITLNTKSKQGVDLFLALAKHADVIVENLKPGNMARVGLGYEAVRAVNPAIIYCSLSGFGQTGPYRDRLAYDAIIQAMSGMMAITGQREMPPVQAGAPVADTMTPVYAALAIVSAMRFRDNTGLGQFIDVSMLEAVQTAIWVKGSDYNVAHGLPVRAGNNSHMNHPVGTYPTRDGSIFLTAYANHTWHALLRAIGATHLIDDPRFASGLLRWQHASEVDAPIEAWLRERTTEEALAVLIPAQVPCGPVRTLQEVMDDPHLKFRGALTPLPHPHLDHPLDAVVCRFPAQFSEMPTDLHASPALGMNNQEVYGGLLGLSAEELTGLQEKGVI